jgi:hypothetical protein
VPLILTLIQRNDETLVTAQNVSDFELARVHGSPPPICATQNNDRFQLLELSRSAETIAFRFEREPLR